MDERERFEGVGEDSLKESEEELEEEGDEWEVGRKIVVAGRGRIPRIGPFLFLFEVYGICTNFFLILILFVSRLFEIFCVCI